MMFTIETSGTYLISLFLTSSLFLFWCKNNWIIILLIVYILGKSKHLIDTYLWKTVSYLECWKTLMLLYVLWLVTRNITTRYIPTGKLPTKTNQYGNQCLTRTTRLWVKNPNPSKASYKPKHRSYIRSKNKAIFLWGYFLWGYLIEPLWLLSWCTC